MFLQDQQEIPEWLKGITPLSQQEAKEEKGETAIQPLAQPLAEPQEEVKPDWLEGVKPMTPEQLKKVGKEPEPEKPSILDRAKKLFTQVSERIPDYAAPSLEPKKETTEKLIETPLLARDHRPLKQEQMDPITQGRIEGFKRSFDKKWFDKYTPLINDLLSGFYGSAGMNAAQWASAANWISKILGIPEEKRGSVFKTLAQDWMRRSASLEQRGLGGIAGEVAKGAGQFGWDIPQIMMYGQYGLAVHGAVQGTMAEGWKGGLKSGLQGALTHGIIKGISQLPSFTKYLGWAGLGAGMTPGGVKEKVAGALTWSMLGLTGGNRRVTFEEFVSRYPKLEGKLNEAKSAKIISYLNPDIDIKEAKKIGAKKLLDKSIEEINRLARKKTGMTLGEFEGELGVKVTDLRRQIREAPEKATEILKPKPWEPPKPTREAKPIEPTTPEAIAKGLEARPELRTKVPETPTKSPIESAYHITKQLDNPGKTAEKINTNQKELIEPQKTEQKIKSSKGYRFTSELLNSQINHKPATIRKTFKEAKIEPPDDLMRQAEETYAHNLASKAGGKGRTRAAQIYKALRRAGVREDIARRTRVMNRYRIEDLVKVKKSKKTGEQAAALTKGLIDLTKKTFVGMKNANKNIKKYSFDNAKKILKGIAGYYEVPRLFFKRMGLTHIYDWIRQGERDAITLWKGSDKSLLKATLKALGMDVEPKKVRGVRDEVIEIFKGLSKAEGERVFDWFAAKRGEADNMRKAGIKPPKWSDLNKKQKLAIARWDSFIRKWTPVIKDLARKAGKEFKEEKIYFPLRTSRAWTKAAEIHWVSDEPRLHPFFYAIEPRETSVPYKQYDRNVKRVAENFGWSMVNFLEIGRRTIPAKYYIESQEFRDIVGKAVQSEVRNWVKHITTPEKTEIPQKAVRFLRRMTMRSMLGMNPETIVKQALSPVDLFFLEKVPMKVPSHIKKIVKNLPKASKWERYPAITMADMNSAVDRALLGGITWLDRYVAGGMLNKMMARELIDMEKKGINIRDNSTLKKVIKRASDKVDLAAAGTTRAQRPKAFRTEGWKFVNMFMTTVNSRLQAYMQKFAEANKGVVGALKGKDAKEFAKYSKMLAKTLAGFFFTAYAERTVNNLTLNERDVMKETLLTALGNVPIIGGVAYATEYGDYNVSPVGQQIEKTIEAINKWGQGESTLSDSLEGIGMFTGFPKQIAEVVEGFKVIKKGQRVSANNIIEIDDPIDQFRAFIKGEYAPLPIREFYDDRELKSKWNKRIAKTIFSEAGQARKKSFKDVKPTYVEEHIHGWIDQLPKHKRNRVKSIIKKAKANELELSYRSIANYLEKLWFKKVK